MRKSAQTEQDVLPIVGQCLEGIQRCTDSINEKEVRSEPHIFRPYLYESFSETYSCIECHYAVLCVKSSAESDQDPRHVFFSVTSEIFLILL